jgi:hypothetical protein
MQMPRPHWSDWANQLHRLKLDAIAAWLLEAGAPVTLLGAQALFVARPFLGPQSEALAHLLEEENEVRAFAAFLREEAIA